MNTETEQPLISIVIATYNGEKYLHEQLDSLFSQTYKNVEIIAIDDCSSDSSVSILNEYASRHSNMKVFVNEKNLKHIKTFERGILLGQGKYISLCDQDDIWDNRKIEFVLAEMKEGVSMAYCDSLFVDGTGVSMNKKISDIKNLTSYDNVLPFIIGNTVSGHASIFEKTLALSAMPFPEHIIHDWWLAFVAALCGKIVFVNLPLVKYRQHEKSVIGAVKVKGRVKKKTLDENKLIRERIKSFYEKCPSSKKTEKEILMRLQKSYSSFSLSNNFLRSKIFFCFQKELLATKNRSPFKKQLFCLKMFFKLI
jgi:glycosyltransferase involved in cell wall biosynthesis